MSNLTKLDGPFVDSKEATKYLVIFLHGWGADGNDLINIANIWKNQISNAAFLAPNAPQECQENPSGRQWFQIYTETKTDLIWQLENSYNSLEHYIEFHLKEKKLPISNFFLVGFSQGTMLSIFFGLRKKCLGIVGYSGAFVEHKTPLDIKKNEFLLIHGKNDSIVPVEKTHEAKKKLKNLCKNVNTIIYDNLEHSISEDGLSAGLKFIKERARHA